MFKWLHRREREYKHTTELRLVALEQRLLAMRAQLGLVEIKAMQQGQEITTLKERVAALEERPVMLPNPWDMAGQFQRVEPLPEVPPVYFNGRQKKAGKA